MEMVVNKVGGIKILLISYNQHLLTQIARRSMHYQVSSPSDQRIRLIQIKVIIPVLVDHNIKLTTIRVHFK